MRERLNSPLLVVGSRIAAVLLTLLSAPLLARALGPDGRGLTAAAIAAITLLPVLIGMGLPFVVRRDAAQPSGAAATVRTARLVALWTIPLAALFGMGLAALIAGLDDAARLALVIACGAAPLSVLWICDANVLLAERRLGAYSAINLFPTGVFVVSILFGWFAGMLQVWFVIGANLFSSVATLILSSLLVRTPLRGKRSKVGRVVREGGTYAGAQIAEAASFRLDQVLAVSIIGATQAGFYSVAATIAMIPFVLGQAIGTTIFRQLATEEHVVKRTEAIAEALRATFLLSLGATSAIAALVPWLIPLVFGEAFAPATMPTLIALLGSISVALGYVASSALSAAGAGLRMTYAYVLGLAVGIGGLLILGPILGATGAAAASALGYGVTTMAMIFATQVGARRLVFRKGDAVRAVRLLVRGT
ncbi:lipopolysaccharide biosynthesis protein [Microbacterium keratanolyticum]